MTDAAERYADLPGSLGKVLFDLKQHPSPHVPNPPGAKKRASVALIVRIKPAYEQAIPDPDASSFSSDKSLDTFFSQDWVKQGSPEVLFIKRIDRSGDRWSGHVALPGGRRDPEDESDLATAIRETQEEVGLDLTSKDCIPVGNLPERIISTTWGHQVLMVICPYVFLWTSPTSPQLRPQPTEIAATHWVPLGALLSPSLRTQQLADFSDRLWRQHGPIVKSLVNFVVGHMTFSAIRLIPSESVFSTSIADFSLPSPLAPSTSSLSPLSRLKSLLAHIKTSPRLPPPPAPLHLWGLTLGILADFLDQFPPHDAVKLWTYPTFTPPDLQFIIWVMTYNKRKQNARTLNDGSQSTPLASQGRRPSNQTAIDGTTAAVAIDDGTAPKRVNAAGKPYAIGSLLDGYYDRLKVAIAVFLAWRLGLSVSAAVVVGRLWMSRRKRL